ncbi:unnamed protein product [Adineta ricciae]|uniref:TROVE domain-containing protein n=1 Tax=Adineta ricciae TaxID=249248 RepID=A0A815JLS0_ADIRI|nr:unnamed protein product [Adineta ricciae]
MKDKHDEIRLKNEQSKEVTHSFNIADEILTRCYSSLTQYFFDTRFSINSFISAISIRFIVIIKIKMYRGRGRGRGLGASRGRGTSRGRVAVRGRMRGTFRHSRPRSIDTDQLVVPNNTVVDLDINFDPKPFFINANVTIDQHIQAQSTNLSRYLAALFTLRENNVEIGQKAKACVLAAAWCRHDHQLAKNLLRHQKLFTLTEVLKAVTMLDAGRQSRAHEKQLKRLELSNTKPKASKLGKIKNNVDNLNKLKPATGSASGAVARHIRRWTRTLTTQELEYFALHMPTEPWRKLADIVHFNPTKDFPALPWFLPFCFGTPAPADTMVARCRDLTPDNINILLKEFKIPYSHLKQFKDQLNDSSKARIASYEETLDTILWYYEDLQCEEVDKIVSERFQHGEQIHLPYGKLMERLLLLQTLRDTTRLTQSAKANKTALYSNLLSVAEAQLQNIKLPLESPVVVLGDASSSMEVAIRTATILSSFLTAVCSAKLNFFNTKMFLPAFTPKTIEDVLNLALETRATGATANAAGLVPYFDSKEIIKTFIMVTDEEENSNAVLADGTLTRFFKLFMRYREEIYPAKLVFISFLRHQHDKGEMYQKFEIEKVPDVIQFKFNGTRPDLTKIDNLLGLLSTGSAASFDERLQALQNEFQQSDVATVINNLLCKQNDSVEPMEMN